MNREVGPPDRRAPGGRPPLHSHTLFYCGLLPSIPPGTLWMGGVAVWEVGGRQGEGLGTECAVGVGMNSELIL